jgi:hypothetical protein
MIEGSTYQAVTISQTVKTCQSTQFIMINHLVEVEQLCDYYLYKYHDEDMTSTDTPMKVKNKASLFLCLHTDISKNLLLLNVGIFNVFREQLQDALNIEETS